MIHLRPEIVPMRRDSGVGEKAMCGIFMTTLHRYQATYYDVVNSWRDDRRYAKLIGRTQTEGVRCQKAATSRKVL